MRPIFCTLLVVLALARPAHAGDAEYGLHIQLAAEMKNLAARNAWSGVDTNYLRLYALEAKGERLTAEEHKLGAEAARALGNIAECQLRLERAFKVGADPAVAGMIVEIKSAYGTATLTVEGKHRPQLLADVPPFAPDQRAAILYANSSLDASRRFDGLLPAGTYLVAGGTLTIGADSKQVAALTATGVRIAGVAAAPVVQVPKEKVDHPVGLIASTAAAAAASGLCYGLAMSSKGDFADTTTTYADLQGIATRTNLLGGLAVGGAAATVGLGVALAVAW